MGREPTPNHYFLFIRQPSINWDKKAIHAHSLFPLVLGQAHFNEKGYEQTQPTKQ
jgi:hypothetical protein